MRWIIAAAVMLAAAAAYAQIGPTNSGKPLNSRAPIGVGSTLPLGPGKPSGITANLPTPPATCANNMTMDYSQSCNLIGGVATGAV